MKKVILSILCLFVVIAMSNCSGSSKQLTDQEILVKIYEAMNGPNWKGSDGENWLSDKPLGEWKGVKVNDEGRVIALAVQGDTVRELIPADIGGLTELEELTINIRNNEIDNIIPAEIGKLIKLKFLRLSLSFFIPNEDRPVLPDLTALVNLEKLFLSGFKGAIPENIAQLSKLRNLYLGSFEWKIPESICGLSNLEHLDVITSSQPEGAVPDCIGRLSKLKRLKIEYSLGFAGAIKQPNAKFPESIWDLTNLEYLSLRTLSNTGGPIPGDKVAKMTNLETMAVADCGIMGTIPVESFASGKLTDLSLYRNNLTGNIPSEIGNCPKLRYIHLDKNQLTGVIPTEIAKCLNLSYLTLDENQLTGNIPEGLAKCEKLSTLNLSGNQLSPNIPAALKAHPNYSKFKF